ncbi:hypothetical protein RE428_01200 [Marinobacter nanhaiticus D15-8W]|uniref:diguanylate cyclase n=1 Tax=Marinobacter nanhaiticus D15-8W TaxID=626887 RepID=N6WUI9_9GAMM|nr:diguanylate cyclase [Marinobacter nanhaiticus]ENO15196.1 GGDEF domain-containing protein [Marinobacter nanhaiticus D15-8W]BES69102.1 hypothetical protein RE428_01200 [Marinobacter nanhaiticus D15-8W]
MISALERFWLLGTQGKPARLVRQIALSNQIGILGALATLPYQVFYLLYDIELYWPVFVCNLVFMAVYLAVPLINRRGDHSRARNLVLINGCTQIFVVTFFIGGGAGIHLFYFAIGSIQALIFRRHHSWLLVAVLAGVIALFMICEFVFTEGVTPLPPAMVPFIFTISVIGTMALSGSFSHLFRTEIDRAEERLIRNNRDLEKLSTTDQLTGLANRRSLDQFLASADLPGGIASAQPLSVLMCDVDCFKPYNDYYGHQAGDDCLRRIAQTLTDVVRRPTDLVVRYGGEEFVVVLPHTAEADASVIAERVREAVDQLQIPHAASTVADHVTLSIGLSALGREESRRAAQVFSRADQALYEAKTQGRNRVVVGT